MFIWSYNKYDAEANFITPSEETRSPLKGVYYDGPKGESPVVAEGISLSRKGILLTAFKVEAGGKLIRLWEQAGISGLCKLSLPDDSSYKKAYACNLAREISDDKGIEIIDNSIQFEISANQPVSFILR